MRIARSFEHQQPYLYNALLTAATMRPSLAPAGHDDSAAYFLAHFEQLINNRAYADIWKTEMEMRPMRAEINRAVAVGETGKVSEKASEVVDSWWGGGWH